MVVMSVLAGRLAVHRTPFSAEHSLWLYTQCYCTTAAQPRPSHAADVESTPVLVSYMQFFSLGSLGFCMVVLACRQCLSPTKALLSVVVVGSCHQLYVTALLSQPQNAVPTPELVGLHLL